MAEGRGRPRLVLLALTLPLASTLAGCGGPLRRVPATPTGAEVATTAQPPGAQARAAYLRGELALARAQPEEALRHFERAALFDPRAAAPRLGQALALEAAGEHLAARLPLAAALERDPGCGPCVELGRRLDARAEASPP